MTNFLIIESVKINFLYFFHRSIFIINIGLLNNPLNKREYIIWHVISFIDKNNRAELIYL